MKNFIDQVADQHDRDVEQARERRPRKPRSSFNPFLRSKKQRDRNAEEKDAWAVFGGPRSRPYRYNLGRVWNRDAERGRVCWVMLNPSTADGKTDDPTIHRCRAFSDAWGFGRLEVVNLSPVRAKDPAHLRHVKVPDQVHELNSAYRTRAFDRADLIVCAWGAHAGAHPLRALVPQVLFELKRGGHLPERLGTTSKGHPRHPLYLRADTLLEEFNR